jgi:hypothetical protein
MESLTTTLEDLVKKMISCDPAIYRMIITDKQGLEIASYIKNWNKKPNEDKSLNPIYPLLNAMSNNSEKFLGFMRTSQSSPFIITWTFGKGILFAASSPFGFIGLFCEPDVNGAVVKKILKDITVQYNKLVASIFRE